MFNCPCFGSRAPDRCHAMVNWPRMDLDITIPIWVVYGFSTVFGSKFRLHFLSAARASFKSFDGSSDLPYPGLENSVTSRAAQKLLEKLRKSRAQHYLRKEGERAPLCPTPPTYQQERAPYPTFWALWVYPHFGSARSYCLTRRTRRGVCYLVHSLKEQL